MRTIIIEDQFMRKIREGRWSELDVLVRDQIYFHGLVKILRSLIDVNNWKLCASWDAGCRSSIFAFCRSLDNIRLVGGNGYGLVGEKVTAGRREIMLPIDVHSWVNHIQALGRDDCYGIDRTIIELSELVGSGDDPALMINSAKFIYIEGDDPRDEAREHMVKLAEESQEHIFRSLMKGGDLIVYPLGCSLQSLLSLITSSHDCTESNFRLQAVDNRRDHQISFSFS